MENVTKISTPYPGEICPVNIPVQMMAVTDRDGKITPLWFRFEAEDHHIEKVMVEKTISRDESVCVGVREKRFICSGVGCFGVWFFVAVFVEVVASTPLFFKIFGPII